MKVSVLDAQRSADNYFNVDLQHTDIDAGDIVWFRAARRLVDLTDADALILKGRNIAPLSGIVDLDAAAGTCQVQLKVADFVGLEDDEALVFHVVLRKADANMDTEVAGGVLRLSS